MTALRPIILGMTIAVAASVCATRVQVPEIPILDSPVFKADRREPDPKPTVQYVEVSKPLPLPGQSKPLPKPEDKLKEQAPPKDRITRAHKAARCQRWLHQCHPGLPLHPRRSLSALCGCQSGRRHRLGARREACVGFCRRHRALGGGRRQ